MPIKWLVQKERKINGGAENEGFAAYEDERGREMNTGTYEFSQPMKFLQVAKFLQSGKFPGRK